MKKVFLTSIILLVLSFIPMGFAFSIARKLARGRAKLGGTVSFTHSSYKEGSIGNLRLMPAIGYFAIPKLALEPKLLVAHSSTSPEDGGAFSVTDFGLLFNKAYHF